MAQTLLTRNIGPYHIHKGLLGSNRVFYFYFSFIFAFSLPIRVQKSLKYFVSCLLSCTDFIKILDKHNKIQTERFVT